jgi:hypothetical protein
MDRLRTFNELSRLKYSFLYKIYQSYRSPIQRVDIGRLSILHIEGGIYMDLDAHPSSISTGKLCQYRFIAPQVNNFHTITNHFFISERNSTHLQYLLLKSVEKAKVLIWIDYLQGFWRDSNHTPFANILICSYIRSFLQYKSFSSKLFFWF